MSDVNIEEITKSLGYEPAVGGYVARIYWRNGKVETEPLSDKTKRIYGADKNLLPEVKDLQIIEILQGINGKPRAKIIKINPEELVKGEEQPKIDSD